MQHSLHACLPARPPSPVWVAATQVPAILFFVRSELWHAQDTLVHPMHTTHPKGTLAPEQRGAYFMMQLSGSMSSCVHSCCTSGSATHAARSLA